MKNLGTLIEPEIQRLLDIAAKSKPDYIKQCEMHNVKPHGKASQKMFSGHPFAVAVAKLEQIQKEKVKQWTSK